MKALILTCITLLVAFTNSSAEEIPTDSLYFGQPTPGDSGVVFAAGRISVPGRNEPCISFSPDGKTAFFYNEFYPNPGTPYVLITEYKNGKWSTPDTASFAAGRATGEPIFSPDGSKLLMFATASTNGVGSTDLAYSVKNESGWSEPVSFGNPPNTFNYEYHPCMVGDNSIYFSTSGGPIARSQYANGVYLPRVILPTPINNPTTPQTWGDPFVPADESYMLIKSKMAGGYGQHDIYISYRKTNGGWTNPKNLGNKINTEYDETTGDITPDGKYMTYGSNKDLHWVKTTFIEKLKHTNYIPYLKKAIPAKTDTLNKAYNYTVPDTTFVDDDGNNTLTYSAALSNGNPLPTWLNFNPATKTLSGTLQETGTLSIKVTAIDTLQAAVSSTFNLKVVSNTAISESEKFEQLVYAYPNPFNPATTINFTLAQAGQVNLTIFNAKGETIAELLNKQMQSGTHSAVFNAGNLNSGVYFYKLSINGNSIIRKIALIK